MMRGSEMYLIIAELAADNNHEDEALAALNKVREARGISAYSGTGDVLKQRYRMNVVVNFLLKVTVYLILSAEIYQWTVQI